MKVQPPTAESFAALTESESALGGYEQAKLLGLQGVLRAFESTPLVPLIKEALEAAAIDPTQYDLRKSGHYNYYGLPATEPGISNTYALGDEQRALSPIVDAVYNGLQTRKITSKQVEPNTVHFVLGTDSPEINPNLLNRLAPILVESFQDSVTGELLAYATPLSLDGGRAGKVILSTTQVVANELP